MQEIRGRQDKRPDFLADFNAGILDSLTEGGRVKNMAGLAGEAVEINKVSDICGFKFNGYLATIKTVRPKGAEDEVVVAFTDAAVDLPGEEAGLKIKTGSRLLISGRQQALKDFRSGRVLVYTLADYISVSPKAPHQNDVALVGELAYKPVYRRTPKGARIADIFVKTENIFTGKDCYIPCICWHGAADMAAGWEPGDGVKLLGRCQSRDYVKIRETEKNGRMGTIGETRTAHEISISLIKKIGEAS